MGRLMDWCTSFPDKLFGIYYGDCCKAHDDDYTENGNYKDKLKADFDLMRCVGKKGLVYLKDGSKLAIAGLAVAIVAVGMFITVVTAGVYYWIKAEK